MKVVNYIIPHYQEISGKSSEVIRVFKGLNSYDPLSIPSNTFTELINLDFIDYPTLTTRKGFRKIHEFGKRSLGMGVWKGIELHIILNDGEWYKYTGNSFTKVRDTMNTSSVYSFTNFQGNLPDVNLFVCNGNSGGIIKYDGTNASPHGNAPTDINYITTYQNRLWGTTSKNEICACVLDDSSNWTKFVGDQDDAFRKTIESERGESITMLSGGLSKLVIGMNNSVKELYGGLPQDFQDKTVSEYSGFINNTSNTVKGGTLYGVHETGVYTYSGGTLPNKYVYDVINKFNYDLSKAKGCISFDNGIFFAMDGYVLKYNDRSEVESWTLFNNVNIDYFSEMGNKLYAIDINGNVFVLDSDTDDGQQIPFKLVTKVFNNESIANRQRLYKVYLTVDLKQNSILNVSLSKTINDNDWNQVATYTGSQLGVQRLLVPVGNYAWDNFLRIKLEGTGNIKLYEINREFRTLPLV